MVRATRAGSQPEQPSDCFSCHPSTFSSFGFYRLSDGSRLTESVLDCRQLTASANRLSAGRSHLHQWLRRKVAGSPEATSDSPRPENGVSGPEVPKIMPPRYFMTAWTAPILRQSARVLMFFLI